MGWKAITILTALYLAGCNHNVSVYRYSDDQIEIKALRPHTTLLLPDGTIIVDTQGSGKDWSEKVLQTGSQAFEKIMDAAGNVELQIDTSDDDD